MNQLREINFSQDVLGSNRNALLTYDMDPCILLSNPVEIPIHEFHELATNYPSTNKKSRRRNKLTFQMYFRIMDGWKTRLWYEITQFLR